MRAPFLRQKSMDDKQRRKRKVKLFLWRPIWAYIGFTPDTDSPGLLPRKPETTVRVFDRTVEFFRIG
jgi:hypothetical protein